MEAVVRSQNHVGDDRRLFRKHVYALAIYRLVALLSGTRATHERGSAGGCGWHTLFLRLRGRGDGRLALRLPHQAWMGADCGAQNASLMRAVRHLGLYF